MKKKIIVVGGVAGGASFAARMRRLDEEAEITIYEKGEYISFANCGLPYHVGKVIKNREKLIIQTPEKFNARFNIDVQINSEVTDINPEKNIVTVFQGNKKFKKEYDYLLLSPGCKPMRPPIDGIDNLNIFTLRNINDMDSIISTINKKEINRAVVVGAGFIGLEMAENLRHIGMEVSLVELSDQVFIPSDKEMAHTLHQHINLNGVRLFLSDGVKQFINKDHITTVVLNSGKKIDADIVILSIGVKPDTEFIKDSGIKLRDNGAIIVDGNMKTNYKNIYAAGDAVEVTDFVSGKQTLVPLAGPANRQGRIAADNISGISSSYKNTQGTAICKVFDLTAAVTGLNEKNAIKYKIPFIKTYIHSANHAGYYPNAYPLTIKLLFTPDKGTVLGAQVIGKNGVDKRIDILATAVRHKFTVYDLTELELAYAPPFGSAKDPVNMAGFTAENILKGKVDVFYAEDIPGIDLEKNIILDVRTSAEVESGTIPNAKVIPVDDLRDRLNELDKNKGIYVYCKVGLRGYLACRILTQNGFKCKNLSGGYKTWLNTATENYDGSYIQPLNEAVCSSPSGTECKDKTIKIDACGLQCPGPIMKLKEEISKIKDGSQIEIKATDPGFSMDIPAWCSSTGNTLISLNHDKGIFDAIIAKGTSDDHHNIETDKSNKKTLVVFSNDFDKMMATFIIANGAASMGDEVTMFFTFWGLNLLRKDQKIKVKKSLLEKMFSSKMPQGASKTVLSKMNMGGLGTKMMKHIMKKKNVYSLKTLMEQALKNNIKMIACTMSMDIMGIKKEELIDGIEYGGVAYYLEKANHAGYNLFI